MLSNTAFHTNQNKLKVNLDLDFRQLNTDYKSIHVKPHEKNKNKFTKKSFSKQERNFPKSKNRVKSKKINSDIKTWEQILQKGLSK